MEIKYFENSGSMYERIMWYVLNAIAGCFIAKNIALAAASLTHSSSVYVT